MPEFTSQQSHVNPTELNLNVYQTSDVDDASNVQYFGYLNSIGQWVISKWDKSVSPKTMRYQRGKSGYATAWSGRAGLSYQYYNALF